MNEGDPQSDTGAAPTGETFPITLGRRAGFGLRATTPQSLGLKGNASLLIGEGRLLIRATKSAGFRKEPVAITFDLDDIFDVEQARTIIRFSVRAETGPRRVEFEAGKDATAARIVDLLPKRVSPELAGKIVELAEFHERLDRLTARPKVTALLVALNVAVFVIMAIGGAGFFNPDGEVIVGWGSNFGPLTMAGGQWWRLFTATFIHFGILHLALNMWALYSTGLTTERLYGSGRFALLYVFAGLTGSIGSLLWNPMVNSAGASGAIFGVYGGLLAFAVRPNNGVPSAVMSEHRNSTLIFAAYNLFYGASHAGIDNAAHVGGLVGGFLIGLALARPLDDRRLAHRGQATMLAIIAGACLFLFLAATPLLRPSAKVAAQQHFETALVDFDARQADAITAMQKAFALAKAGTTESEFAAATDLKNNVVPKWAALEQKVSGNTLPADDPNFHRQALMRRYLKGRRVYCELISRSVLEGNDSLRALAEQADADSQSAVAEINQLDGHK